jgi:GMP synthase-like glutamine amidotransferase
MKPIRIFRHMANEGPGYLSEFLDRHGIPFEMVRIDAGEPVPPSLDDISGLVFMGGPTSVNDPLPWVADELKLIHRATAAGIPLLGHCLGGQLISKALGGCVGPNPVQEIGWHEVQQIPNEASREWMEGLPQTFPVFHWHGETFSIPRGATPILRSRHCENQGFVVGNTLALQCHVEMTVDLVEDWALVAKDELRPSASVQSAAEMQAGIHDKVNALNRVADVLYARWLHSLSA